jgi:hypothetical protein
MIDGYEIEHAIDIDHTGKEIHVVWPILLPGCLAQADSKDAAMEKLQAILPAFKAAMKRHGVDVPKPEE